MEREWLVRIWFSVTNMNKWVEEREVSAGTDTEAIARAFAKCQQPMFAVDVEVAFNLGRKEEWAVEA